ncbi:WD repeat-containing protein 20-like [Impatiens glandulifera]|uniref:WD repeat-containing protein 20-like n=1 Tax=Impatiens glandulifera TaxID=253017 RepID=UPI001FB103E7|nr:WD repeat-containing protein 20-like [Impatiens glandulifera]
MGSNPIARWHICRASINAIAFSADGKYLATVGRDGYLRVFDYHNELLFCGGKSYYGALLCCAWSADGKYILTGGEDDLVQVWSIEDRKIVAWGEGHNSWVSGVYFDSYQLAPTPEVDMETNVVYRFGSVGQVCFYCLCLAYINCESKLLNGLFILNTLEQDAQLLLWDLAMEEIVVPVRRCVPGGLPHSALGANRLTGTTQCQLAPSCQLQE